MVYNRLISFRDEAPYHAWNMNSKTCRVVNLLVADNRAGFEVASATAHGQVCFDVPSKTPVKSC